MKKRQIPSYDFLRNEYLIIHCCFGCWAFLTALSFPMAGLPFIWLSFAPMIYIIHRLPLKKIAKYGFFWSLVYYFATLFWLIAFHEASIFFVFPLYAVYSTVAMMLIRYVSIKFKLVRFLIFPLIWMAFEIFRGIGFLGFRWNTPADALWKQIVFLQSADIVGSAGVGFLVLLMNSIFAEFALQWQGSFSATLKKIWQPAYLTLFLFLGNLVYGISSLRQWDNFLGKVVSEKVALVQPNRPGNQQWDENKKEMFLKFKEMAAQAKAQKADLIVQTEIMTLDYLWESLSIYGENHPRNFYNKQLIELPKDFDIPMVLTHFASDENLFSYNAATFVSYSNDVMKTNIYRKIHIVPFGEWVPGSKHWKWLDNLLSQFGAAWASPGTELTVFETRDGRKFAMLICFEDIFAILGRLFVEKGIEFFVNATNDGWAYRWKFGAKTPLWQHLANTVHTSIALRRSIARSVNTGITAVVHPTGKVDLSNIPEYQDGVFVADVPVVPGGYRSLYVQLGWVLEYVIFFIALSLSAMALVTDKKAAKLRELLK